MPFSAIGRSISKQWKALAGFGAVVIYFLLLSHRGLRAYFSGDDVANLIAMHGYWRWPWWKHALDALLVVTPTYRPMGDVFYRLLYGVFGFHPLPFRAACFALMVVNLGLFFRLALTLTRSREAALLGALVFSFHGALNDLYLSAGTVYDILCVCFTLAAWLFYARLRERGRELRARDILILLLFCGAALDSKEMAASLPPALLLYEVILAPKAPWQRWWRRAAPALLAGALTAAALAVKVRALADNPAYRPNRSPAYMLANAAHYAGMLFYGGTVGPAWLLALAALGVLACIAARRPVALFGLCYGLLALIPVVTVTPRDGFVLYLPLAGFALFFGDMASAARRAAARFVPLNPAAVFAVLAAGLFAVHSRHWRPSEDGAMRETVRLVEAWRPTLPAGARLLFLDDPLPKNQFTLLFLLQAAYRDPLLSVERQNNSAAPIEPAAYAVFDFLISIRDGKLTALPLTPRSPAGPAIPVAFTPDAVEPGEAVRMRAGTYYNAAVDIEYQRTYRYEQVGGVALRWTNLDADGVATIPLSRLEDPSEIRITAIRVSGDVWRKADGRFAIR